VQQIVDTAARYERHVALVGRSMVNNVQMAIELGYLNIPKGMLIRAEDINKFQAEQVVIICTGSQGEPTSALTRIANQDHRLVRIQPGDTVILSATPVPGNEKMVSRTINNLPSGGGSLLFGQRTRACFRPRGAGRTEVDAQSDTAPFLYARTRRISPALPACEAGLLAGHS
jgi:ribonuclease J